MGGPVRALSRRVSNPLDARPAALPGSRTRPGAAKQPRERKKKGEPLFAHDRSMVGRRNNVKRQEIHPLQLPVREQSHPLDRFWRPFCWASRIVETRDDCLGFLPKPGGALRCKVLPGDPANGDVESIDPCDRYPAAVGEPQTPPGFHRAHLPEPGRRRNADFDKTISHHPAQTRQSKKAFGLLRLRRRVLSGLAGHPLWLFAERVRRARRVGPQQQH